MGYVFWLFCILIFFNYIIRQNYHWFEENEKEKNRNYIPGLYLGPPCHTLLGVRNEISHCLNILSITMFQMEGIKSQHHSSSRHPSTGVKYTPQQGKVNNLLRLNVNPIITLKNLRRTTRKITEMLRAHLLLAFFCSSLHVNKVRNRGGLKSSTWSHWGLCFHFWSKHRISFINTV